MQNFRLINSGYNTAAMNMAVDEVLLDSKLPVLRFYQWQPSAISIGYSQKLKEEINIDMCKKQGINFVRRLTGGKAVLHDKELTYSIILDEKTMPKTILESYKFISKGLLLALQKIGVNAEMRNEIDKSDVSAICFSEPSYYEIVVNGKKIVGSAQVRKKGKILQHGSVLIDVDVEKLCLLFNYSDKNVAGKVRKRVTSINNELGKKVFFEEVAEAMKEGFGKNFKAELLPDKLTEEEMASAKILAKEKYSSEEWNFMR